MKPLTSALFAALSLGIVVVPRMWAEFPALALKPVSLQQIVSPVSISNAGDGSKRLFVCDQAGKIWVVRDEMVLPVPFLDLGSKVVPKAPTSYLFPLSTTYDERGLLGLAFHPNYNRRDINNQPLPGFGKFYVFYSAPSPNVRGNPTAPATTPVPVNCRTVISEFQVSGDANVADPNSERILLSFDKPQSNHNGGQLEFGPDGYLYFSAGDGGGSNDRDLGHNGATNPATQGNLGNAQDKTSLLGKIHRIDPLGTNGPGGQYGIPASNPFVGAGGGVREEIYAYGLRNTWRFSFDIGPSSTGRLFAADAGQVQVEEVNIITAGGNYGWRAREGSVVFDAAVQTALVSGGTVRTDAGNVVLPGGETLIDPIAQYAHTGLSIGSPPLQDIGASAIGGYVYRGSAIPGLVGKYVFGDYSQGIPSADGTLLGLEESPANSNNWSLSVLPIGGNNRLTTRVYAFGRDEDGELYVATKVTRGPFELDVNGRPTGAIYKIVAANVSTTTLNPSKDNSMFSESPGNSNALGGIYAGTTAGGAFRRGLLVFDIAGQLAPGAIVTGAQLTLNLNQAPGIPAPANVSMTLHRLTESWGEATSGPSSGAGSPAVVGDATWTARFYDATSPTLWTTAGGTFNAAASATATVGTALTDYIWRSSTLATEVRAWQSSPATNFGWLLRGDETVQSARRFGSRESSAALRPRLQIEYNPTLPPPSRRESWLRQYFPTPGTYVDDLADLDSDGISNVIEYAYAFSPLATNAPAAGLQTSAVTIGATTTYTITFRRDPRATDLTYVLETSDDLIVWNPIAQSVAGAVPTGVGFVSEADAVGEAPVKVVTAVENVAAPGKRFSRLRIIRSF